jgi:hypothetical protein
VKIAPFIHMACIRRHRYIDSQPRPVPWDRLHAKEFPMSEENPKTPLDHVNDTLSQLKEMRHYAKNNVELLTREWLLFDGELSKLKQAGKIEDLMGQQSQFYDSLEKVIGEMEELAVQLQPPPEETAAQ